MHRRQFLVTGCSLLGASLTGCVNTTTGADDDDTARVITIESQSPDIDAPEIVFEADVVSSRMDGENPPRIQITVTNLSDNDLRMLGGNRNVFGETSSDNSEGLWFLSTGRVNEATRANDGCWMIEPPVARTEAGGEVQLDTGDSDTIESDIYGDVEAFDGNCPETGTYHFNQSYTLEIRRNHGSDGNPWEKTDSVEWGFSLRVK